MQVADNVVVPSTTTVEDVVHWAGSMPDPLSDQFHDTVTAVLFHPAPFTAGACVGAATGAVESAGVIRLL